MTESTKIYFPIHLGRTVLKSEDVSESFKLLDRERIISALFSPGY